MAPLLHPTTRPSTHSMPDEYVRFGKLSEKTDSYAFGVVLAELMTGQKPKAVIDMICYDGDFFKGGAKQHQDPRAADWPSKAFKGVAAVAEHCAKFMARDRATAREALPKLKALTKRW